MEIGAPLGRARKILDDEPAGPPGAAAGCHRLADREPHQRRDLLGSLEIVVRRALEALALEGDDALIAGHVAAGIDGESHVAAAEQILARAGPATLALSKRARARKFDGASKSTSSIETGPSVFVCSWKRPSSFSVEPSSAASVTASATSFDTGSG